MPGTLGLPKLDIIRTPRNIRDEEGGEMVALLELSPTTSFLPGRLARVIIKSESPRLDIARALIPKPVSSLPPDSKRMVSWRTACGAE